MGSGSKILRRAVLVSFVCIMPLLMLGALVVARRITASSPRNQRIKELAVRALAPPEPGTPEAMGLSREELDKRIILIPTPGPTRNKQLNFVLGPTNALRMTGKNNPITERWSDISGNYYSPKFISEFSYQSTNTSAPAVWVRIDPVANTLQGRLEARRLKPNFAYQIKLFGLYDQDKHAFEIIGRHGRWRMPGWATNYSDKDYEEYGQKEKVEAYLFFDFFVTDIMGNAVREFALDSSLHVLWNARRGSPWVPDDTVDVVVIADGHNYARPKHTFSTEYLWAEVELKRYNTLPQVISLPQGSYKASIILTEESFHSADRDGGWWATVYHCPIEFQIKR